MKIALLTTLVTGLAVASPDPSHYKGKGGKGGNGGNGGQSICDKYTTALLKDNTAANQQTLLTLLVNTAVIGNYSDINTGVAVPGILAQGQSFGGEQVNLLPYFNGALASSNRGGKCGVSINFLDGGGAAPLMNNMPANSPDSEQFDLLTHLYEFFASLLGCSKYGNTIKRYDGSNGQYQVHKFMALDENEVGYFIQQVGLAAASFGVSSADISTVANALNSGFNMRCLPPSSYPAFEPPALNSICTECSCPKSTDCQDYGAVVEPKPAGQCQGWCGGNKWHNAQQYCDKGKYHGHHGKQQKGGKCHYE